MAPGVLSHRLHTYQGICLPDHFNSRSPDFLNPLTSCHYFFQRGFDTFFGEFAQQADHYTREHEINKHIGSGYDLWRGANVRLLAPLSGSGYPDLQALSS